MTVELAPGAASPDGGPVVVADVGHDLALAGAVDAPGRGGGTRTTGAFPGEPADLLARLARAPWRHQVVDLVVAEPDLEQAVLAFYGPSRQGQPA